MLGMHESLLSFIYYWSFNFNPMYYLAISAYTALYCLPQIILSLPIKKSLTGEQHVHKKVILLNNKSLKLYNWTDHPNIQLYTIVFLLALLIFCMCKWKIYIGIFVFSEFKWVYDLIIKHIETFGRTWWPRRAYWRTFGILITEQVNGWNVFFVNFQF